VNYKDILNRQ